MRNLERFRQSSILSKKPTALFPPNPSIISPMHLKAVTVINQTLEGYASRFWKNIFRPKYIDLVQSVQIYLVYHYPATLAKHFSFANTAVDSVVNATLNLARHLKTILSRRT